MSANKMRYNGQNRLFRCAGYPAWETGGEKVQRECVKRLESGARSGFISRATFMFGG